MYHDAVQAISSYASTDFAFNNVSVTDVMLMVGGIMGNPINETISHYEMKELGNNS